ncbi:MAG: PrsW family intramembrane metalloprotease [Phycisphaeraceae bacterium]|nr:PrsW family intramembrane metalloprotease [Phycisphaeraceae bacterium]
MLLYATLLLCSVAIGAQVYRYDLYDREPPHAILLALIGGAIGLHLAGLAQVAFIAWMGTAIGEHFNLWLALAAGTTEELAKISIVAFVALARPRWFNDPLDGAIYGAFAGLGAAVYESIVHLGWPAAEPFLPATEPIRLMGHLIMGGIGGFGVGFVKVLRASRGWWWLTGCLLGAMALHTLWDVIAFDAADRGKMLPWHTAGSVMLMLAGMVTFRLLVRKGAEKSREWVDERVAVDEL